MENQLSRMPAPPARIGKISYVNTAPFYHKLIERADPAFTLVEGTPAQINHMMSSGTLDLAPVSSLEYVRRQDQYLVLPYLCIGSRDFSRSVILFSHEHIEGLAGATIVLTKKSLSSKVLLKILLKHKYGFKNAFVEGNGDPDEMLRLGKAALAIGDEALFYKPKRFVFKYDLSELWWSWQQVPFCFALWAVRRDFYEANTSRVFDFYWRLRETVERNLQDLEALLRDALDLTIANERFAPAFGYLFNLTYCLDSYMIEGLERFYHYAHLIGEAPAAKPLEFIETKVPSAKD